MLALFISLFIMTFIATLLFIPLLLIDSGLLFVLGGQYESTWALIQFLFLFYVIDVIVSIGVKLRFTFLQFRRQRPMSWVTSFVVESFISVAILFGLHTLVDDVTLPVQTMIAIAVMHSVASYAVPTMKRSTVVVRRNVDPEEMVEKWIQLMPYERELQQLLRTESKEVAVQQMHQRYPHIPIEWFEQLANHLERRRNEE